MPDSTFADPKAWLSFVGLIAMMFCGMNAQATAATGEMRPFVAADLHANKVYKVDATGSMEWQIPAKAPHDLWLLGNGHVLFPRGDIERSGVVEVATDGRVVWEYLVEKGQMARSCQALANGNILIASSGRKSILREVDRKGECRFRLDFDGVTRLCRKTAAGTYLVPIYAGKEVREYNVEGKLIRTIKVPWGAFLAVRLANGNTLIGCGEGHAVIEIDRDDRIVWQIQENELPGCPLRFVAGLQRLKNGNTVICNWGGHGHLNGQPQIIEVTPDKRIIWQLFDYQKFGTPAHVQIVDEPGIVESEGGLLR